jgi:hypothetical protein
MADAETFAFEEGAGIREAYRYPTSPNGRTTGESLAGQNFDQVKADAEKALRDATESTTCTFTSERDGQPYRVMTVATGPDSYKRARNKAQIFALTNEGSVEENYNKIECPVPSS